ncbi:MAG: CPBP family intramembrane metalloprotease [Candidatus Binatus sp.]|uniref:CPBP family intramembrane glutamic endopeptidase n=1 Tax=Candidatus Binatus sp. TaxID=2811406 RepID=UPI0027209CEC|nr:CPBP family intramembrane glutamic endopeptidase [Candidatus Binatus sp.]MDO8432296.1 CPBP family intramembrane metalloprotease [Candidatus Binatus sp.]
MSWIAAWESVGLASKLVVITAIPAIVVYWERRSLTSIGIRGISVADILATFAIILVCLQLDHQLLRIASSMPVVMAELKAGSVLYASLRPKWLDVAGLIANAVAEEIGYRGYAIERIQESTQSTTLAIAVPLAMNVVVHAPIWGIHGMLIKLPALLPFVILYFWRRSLLACILAHLMLDVVAFEL